jgi:hypothetical protein
LSWLSFAEAQHTSIGFDLDSLLESYDMARSVLGADWLDNQGQKDRTVDQLHPLTRELKSSTNQGLVTVTELAMYLRSFASDPALGGVLADPRSDKYPSTLFELAMTHRWKKAGADVRLQPPTPSGIADFDASIEGLRFVVECSVSPDRVFEQADFVLPRLVSHVVADALDREPFAIAVWVTVSEPLTGDWQGEFRRIVKTLVRQVIDHTRKGTDTHVSHITQAWRIELGRITESTEDISPGSGNWDVAVRTSLKPRTEGQAEYKILEERRRLERVRVFLKGLRGIEWVKSGA